MTRMDVVRRLRGEQRHAGQIESWYTLASGGGASVWLKGRDRGRYLNKRQEVRGGQTWAAQSS